MKCKKCQCNILKGVPHICNPVMLALRARIAELEAENAKLKARFGTAKQMPAPPEEGE